MKAASIADIKKELKEKTASELIELSLRLARFKKDNKELLSYLLFEQHDWPAYVQSIKEEMDEAFEEINTGSLFWIKKSLRKILRLTNKHIRYMGEKEGEVELLLYFVTQIKEFKIPIKKSTQLQNLYQSQVKKIEAAIATLHEDLQHDYYRQLEAVQ
ncbi:hypothetical protein [Flavisolibacter tropicus]|uniref:Uncharacterized protein n=1 Tax=Flavisolibacter tropicus TaxID=1492898 RepID=A0A172TZF1_9BACT|nr:hypothetical protein [Flavisolibacter tropicus]ANE52362.1 hypothetical protein SY85_19620 [Flavisolibacter tropicus]